VDSDCRQFVWGGVAIFWIEGEAFISLELYLSML